VVVRTGVGEGGGAGAVVVTDGDGDADDGEGDDGERDGEGDDAEGTVGEDGSKEGEGGIDDASAIGICGIDGRTTVGCRDASAGPTARTATHMTSMTRTAAPALRTIRAGCNGRAECLAGNRPSP